MTRRRGYGVFAAIVFMVVRYLVLPAIATIAVVCGIMFFVCLAWQQYSLVLLGH